MGIPKARAGAFGSVYKLEYPNGPAVALKLFNFASPDRERRYRAVEAYVKGLPCRPTGLVVFHYEAEGIRVRGNLHPVQTMDWVEGVTLGEWFKKAMGRGDAGVVRRMADHWVKLIAGLRAVGVAHGDLQHDNVMVANDAPVLVDYDGMCVPDLEGADQLEIGTPAYQHPGRGDQRLSLRLDDFPAWAILIALRAAAADPALYDRYVIRTENDNLLFTPEDHQDPRRSRLWKDLLASADPDVRGWAAALRASLDRPFDQIPPFIPVPTQHRGSRTPDAASPPPPAPPAPGGPGRASSSAIRPRTGSSSSARSWPRSSGPGSQRGTRRTASKPRPSGRGRSRMG